MVVLPVHNGKADIKLPMRYSVFNEKISILISINNTFLSISSLWKCPGIR